MITKIWKPNGAQRKRGAANLAFRLLISLIVFGLVAEPLVLHAQSRRRRQDERETPKKQQKRPRSYIDAFSLPESESDQQRRTPTQIETEVVRIGKAAYDAVIRSGRYIVGPGDTFVVILDRDEGPEMAEVVVGAEGKLAIPYIGAVMVAGLNLSDTNAAIKSAIQERFQHLSIDVTLSRLRTFPINILGEVRWPGAYMATGVEQASELIMRAGGLLRPPEGLSSLRNIQIQRLSEAGHPEPTGRKVDLALWRIAGGTAHNPFLLDGDQILVPVLGDSIGISGMVRNSGNYEFVPGDRIADLIQLGGGLAGNVGSAKAELLRLARNGRPGERLQIDLAMALAGDHTANIPLREGDKCYVEGEDERVTLEGEVRFPGAYPIAEGLSLKALIERAGGFTSLASLAQASVIRKLPEEEKAQGEEDMELERFLSLSQQELTAEERALFAMKTRQIQGRLPVDFVALFQKGQDKYDVAIEGGDIVRVPRLITTVSVMGAVVTPGAIPYDATHTVRDYIEQAGGFGARAQKGDIIVIKSNTGNQVKASRVKRIDPGDTILVPNKIPGEGWRIFREALVVVTQMVTLIYLISQTGK